MQNTQCWSPYALAGLVASWTTWPILPRSITGREIRKRSRQGGGGQLVFLPRFASIFAKV